MRKRLIAVVVTSLLGITSVAAQEYVFPFIGIERNPSHAAMAGAGSVSGGAFSSMRNPSSLAFGASEALVSYQNWAPSYAKSTNINGGVALKFGEKFGMSVSGAFQAGEPYTLYSEEGVGTETFSPKEIVAGIGAGYAVTPNLSFGLDAKFATQSLSAKQSLNCLAFDVAAMYRIAGARISAGVANLGPAVKASNGTAYPLPSSAFIAADYSIVGVNIAMDADYYLKGGIGVSLGAQYSIKDIVQIRAGYHYGSEDSPMPSYASVGAGATFAGFIVSGAFIFASETLRNTLSLGLGYSF